MTYEQYTSGNGIDRRSSAEIQSDLRDIRGEIQHTLHALGSQLQPGALVQQAFNALRIGGGGRYWRNLLRSVEDNPLPVALIGAGFGYLLYSDAQRHRQGRYYAEGERELGEGEEGAGTAERGLRRVREGAHEGSHKLHDLKEGAQGTARRLKEGAHDMSENVRGKLQATRDKMHDVGSYTQDEWRNVSAKAREASERGRDLINEQPLILAGLGVALGAAFAALAPMSRKEHQMLGETGRELKEQAREVAHHATDKAKAVGSEVLETTKTEVFGQGEGSPGQS